MRSSETLRGSADMLMLELSLFVVDDTAIIALLLLLFRKPCTALLIQ